MPRKKTVIEFNEPLVDTSTSLNTIKEYFTQEECYSLIRLSAFVIAHTNKGYICFDGSEFSLLSEVEKAEYSPVTFDYQDFKKFLKKERLTLIFH